MFSDVLSGWQTCPMETEKIWLFLVGKAQFLPFLCRMRRRASNQQFVGRVLAWGHRPSPSSCSASSERGILFWDG